MSWYRTHRNSVLEQNSRTEFPLANENGIVHYYDCHMDSIKRLLKLLEDGEWHRISDISFEIGWTWSRTRRLAELLSEYGLVRYRGSDESVILDPELSSLMRET